ncbi:MAG TPA: hypothetical protein VK589_13265 [Chryseolinea sp.]|nr:hypothetical protein [Chryseolinea sp.]
MKEIYPLLIQPGTALKNRYEDGEVVFERIHPSRKLVISSFSNGLYYCELLGGQVKKALVYFERELRSTIIATDKGE